MANEVKLGGGVASAIPLRSTPSINNMSGGNREASVLVSGINEMIQAVSKVKIAESIQKNEEDKIRAVSQAEVEHLDINNAMQGASYDDNLNKEVNNWRASGLLDTEIRVKAKEYKFNKAVKDLKLDTGEREADNTDVAFFDTFNKLEIKAITPLATEDRKQMQSKIANINSSYIRTGSDSLQDKFNNTVTVNKTYGMNEVDAIGNVMNSAFDLARRGDESLLKELPNVKNSEGVSIIDTIEGSDMYNKLTTNLMDKKEHDEIKAKKDLEFNQEVQATKLYTTMVETKDISGFKLNIDKALETGSISMSQHNSLNNLYKAQADVGAFPKNSDRATYIKAYSQAEQGTLTSDQLMSIQSKLSNSDFELIARKSIEKGGLNGVGNDESRNLKERIKDDTASFSGSAGLNDLTLTFTDKMIFSKRAGYIQQNLNNDVDKFVAVNKRLPTEDEYSKIRDKVVTNSKEVYNTNTVKPPETKLDTTIKSSDNVNGRAKLIEQGKSLKTKEERELWYNSLTQEEQRLLKGK